MKRYKMLYLLVLLVLSGSVSVGLVTAQQDPPTVILVVDDFNGGSIFDNMTELYAALDGVLTGDMIGPALDNLLSQREELEIFIDSLPSPETFADAQAIGQDVNDHLIQILGLNGNTLSRYLLSNYPDVANVFEEFGFPIDTLDGNCAVNYADQGLFSTTGTGLFSTTGTGLFSTTGTGIASGQSHGELVEAEIRELISNYNLNLGEIEVAPVETDNYTTASITKGLLEQVFSRPANSNFVVNMSFAIVPCGRIADIILYDKLLALAESESVEDWDVLRDLLTQLFVLSDSQPFLPGDPLLNFINRECDQSFAQYSLSIDLSVYYSDALDICDAISDWEGELVSVAAAGNSGAPYPYYPAAWESVVSVSANESNLGFGGLGIKAGYSNSGSVLLPGTWNGNQGTSFAAPRYAFAQAVRLLGGDPALISCAASSLWDPPLVDWLTAPPPPSDQLLCL